MSHTTNAKVGGRWLTIQDLRSGLREQAATIRSGHHHAVELIAVKRDGRWQYDVVTTTNAAVRRRHSHDHINDARRDFEAQRKNLGHFARNPGKESQ